MLSHLKNINLDILRSLSFDWNTIIERVRVYTRDKEFKFVAGANITWDIMPQYESCHLFDPLLYFDFDTYFPSEIWIDAAKVENMGVSFYFVDRNKALGRKLKSNILSYSGPTFQNTNLNVPIVINGMFKISQTINSEKDSNIKCINYPNKVYESFRDCDEEYLYQLFTTKYHIMPPWVTRNMSEVTILRLIKIIYSTHTKRYCL